MSNYPPGLRRIVTTHNDDGLAVVESDTRTKPEAIELSPGSRNGVIWTTLDSLPTHDNNNTEDGASRVIEASSNFGIVPPNGTSFRHTDFSPGAASPMHRTSSLDYNILVSGELVHITEDGTEKHLTPGDVVVQKGTMHAWKNPSSSAWSRLVTVLVAAEPATVNGKLLTPAYIPESL